MYNYRENIKNDIIDYITYEIGEATTADFDSLYDQLWVSDSVTGNASGSYTFNTWDEEENLCHSLDLLEEACEEFGCIGDALENGAEYCDVTIRCYLLGEVLQEVLEEMENAREEE